MKKQNYVQKVESTMEKLSRYATRSGATVPQGDMPVLRGDVPVSEVLTPPEVNRNDLRGTEEYGEMLDPGDVFDF